MSELSTRLTRASAPVESHTAQSESKADTACDSLLGTVKSTFDPFKQTFSSEGGTLHHVSEAVNSLASLQGMPSQLLNTGIAQIPLLDKMPGMPAATIGVPHLGTPHAHSHPPSSGFPLPSVGATIGSGCLSVLIGGIPAARVLDIGIAPTCGGITPYFDIQTGSSNTFIGGMRAARMGIDMTRHCNPMGHVGKSGGEAASAAEKGEAVASEAAQVPGRATVLGRAGKAWKLGNAAVGPASGVATSADDASQGEIAAAAMMAAQTAADLAFMMLSNLMGKDPGIEPSMGTLLAGNPTVLIGGFPLPDSQMMWHKAKHGIGKKVRPKLPKSLQELACEFWGEPVSAVTGDVRNDFQDYQTNAVVPFEWSCFYSSGRSKLDSPLGYGYRHNWQHELRLLRTRAVYITPSGAEVFFARQPDGRYRGYGNGYELVQSGKRRFTVRHEIEGEVDFDRAADDAPSALCITQIRDGTRSILYNDTNQRLTQIAQHDGRGNVSRIVAFQHDDDGHIVEVRLTETGGQTSRIARYAYDPSGCMIRSENALGISSNYVFDASRRMMRSTDANGYSFIYRYDGSGRCIESTGQDGLWRTRFQYHPGRTVVTQSDGGVWCVFYNDAGTVTRVVDPYQGSMEYVLGKNGRIDSEVGAGGRVIRWLYDGRGRNTGRADQWGNIWPPKDEAPVLPELPPDFLPGTPLGMQWGDSAPTDLSDAVQLPPKQERLIAPIVERISMSRFGNTTVLNPAGWVVTSISESGGIERFLHDAGGNIVERQDGDGRNYPYEYASWHMCMSETDPLGNQIQYRYDQKEQIESIVDANGNQSGYTYDYRGRVKSVLRHDTLRELYEYDADDHVTRKTDSHGNTLIQLEIGECGLPVKRTLASGETHLYAYDQRGKITKASTEIFDIAIKYDLNGRLISDMRDGIGIVRHTANGSRYTKYLDRFVVRREAISEGEISFHTPTGAMHRILRDKSGRLLLRLGSGTNLLYLFDSAGRCHGRLEWQDIAPTQNRLTRYDYSATGELHRVADSSSGTTEYLYDLAHRVIGQFRDGISVRHFTYDRGGNILSNFELERLSYTEGNRLQASSRARYRYNTRNHLAEEIGHDGRRIEFHYDSTDLLERIEWSDRQEVWTAKYDGLSRRQFKKIGSERTEYYWEGDRLAAEIAPNHRLRIYVYSNDLASVPFMFIDYSDPDANPKEGIEYFIVSNQIGLPERIENSEGQTVWSALDIDPYGKIIVAPGNTINYDFRWAGHHYDNETGLHYNRFRSYHPGLCRYLQSDPIGQSGGINLYAYPSNPLVFIDATGLACVKDGHKSTKGGNCEPSCFVETPQSERKKCPECKRENPDHVKISDEEWNSEKFKLGEHASDADVAESIAKKLAKETLDSFNSNLKRGIKKRTVTIRGIKLKALPSSARPCLSVVVDKQNRRAYFGQNQDWPPHLHTTDSNHSTRIESDVMIRNRILTTAQGCIKKLGNKVTTCCSDDMNHLYNNGIPGRHAEVHATVAALRDRGDSNIGNLVVYNAKMEAHNGSFGDTLEAMPRCDHCNPITDGAIVHHEIAEAEATERL
jgi:RHS repeat-associated protein